MIRKIALLFLLPILAITHYSCETDFDVTADYKEIAIVYGLLSQNDTTHYLRITKAFLGDGNALVYALNPDSSSFGTLIDVKLLEMSDTDVLREIIFDTVTIHNKDAGDVNYLDNKGDFYAPDQLMYKANAILDPARNYKLMVRNRSTGYEIESVTNLVLDFTITKPTAPANNLPKLDFKREPVSNQKIEWNSAANGRLYQPVIQFYYKETSLPNTADTILRFFEWIFPAVNSKSLVGGEKMIIEFSSEEFYRLCEEKVPYPDASVENNVNIRIADYFNLKFVVAGDEFSTYLDVNSPTTGLLLEKPTYTNIENGLGVFSSRYTKNRIVRVGDNIKKDLMNTTELHFFAN